MPTAATIRAQVEASLAERIPSALTTVARESRPTVTTGIRSVDEILDGGLPVGAITEIVGPECSGRTSFTLSFVARMTQRGKVCAWIDVSNALQAESAAGAGVDLSRMLWIGCGAGGKTEVQKTSREGFVLPQKHLVVAPIKRGLHGGGHGGHPRNEVKGLSEAVSGLLIPQTMTPQSDTSVRGAKVEASRFEPSIVPPVSAASKHSTGAKPWSRMDQALRVADLLLQAGGFSAIVLDMGGIAPEFSSRVPLATWFRYRAAAEKSQTNVLLVTQHTCAKSSAELVLGIRSDRAYPQQTVFAGMQYQIEVMRQRFRSDEATKVIPFRKLPQRATSVSWKISTAWAAQR
jgi:recombination protein RecA